MSHPNTRALLSAVFPLLWRVAYLGLVTGLIWLTMRNWGYDDPFITYRYARNLAQGVGFVYNTGEQILSTTTPLLVMILAALGGADSVQRWGLDYPQLSNLLGAFCLALGGLLIWELFAIWHESPDGVSDSGLGLLSSGGSSPIGGWAGLLLYPTFPLLLSTLGSEMPLYLALCLGAFVAYAKIKAIALALRSNSVGSSKQRTIISGWYVVAAVCAGLAVLARPDGWLIPLILASDLFYRNLQHPTTNLHLPILRALLIFLVIVLPWLFFAWSYFGSPVPATLFAKQHQGAMQISQRFFPGFWWFLRGYLKHPYFVSEIILVCMGSLYLVRGLAHRLIPTRIIPWYSSLAAAIPSHFRGQDVFFTWTMLYFIAYSLLGVSRYHWYYAPLIPAFITLVGFGLEGWIHLVRQIRTKLHSRSLSQTQDRLKADLQHPISILASIGLIALLAGFQSTGLRDLARQPDPRLAIYRAVGTWLSDTVVAQSRINPVPENYRISALEVGIIGYYATGRRVHMIDFAGLLNPDVASRLGWTTTYADSAVWVAEHYQPNYLVLQSGMFTVLEAGYAAEHCQIVQQFPAVIYAGDIDLNIYACQSPGG